MDMLTYFNENTHVKFDDLQRDIDFQNMCWRRRKLQAIINEPIADPKERKDAFEKNKLCKSSRLPCYVSGPEDLNITTHQTGSIRARIGGIPKPKVKWYKNWQAIADPRIKEMHHYKPDIYELEIQNARTSDIGLYTCIARNCYGCVTASSTVRIIQSKIKECPRFARRLQSIDIFPGQNSRLEVNVIGTPKSKVKWFKDWIPLKEDNRVKTHHYESHCYVLCIRNAKLTDSGLYTCMACNEVGTVHTSAIVKVNVEGRENLFVYKLLAELPHTFLHDNEWSEDVTRIRYWLEMLADNLRKKEKEERKRELANYININNY